MKVQVDLRVNVGDTPAGVVMVVSHAEGSVSIIRGEIVAIERVGLEEIGTTILKHVGGLTTIPNTSVEFHGGIETAWITGMEWPWDESDPVAQAIRAGQRAARDRFRAEAKNEGES